MFQVCSGYGCQKQFYPRRIQCRTDAGVKLVHDGILSQDTKQALEGESWEGAWVMLTWGLWREPPPHQAQGPGLGTSTQLRQGCPWGGI